MNNSDFHRTGKYIVDYLLPLTLVIGSGIGTYLFTGGEEEFPPVEEEVRKKERIPMKIFNHSYYFSTLIERYLVERGRKV